jgi:hypothetical protein
MKRSLFLLLAVIALLQTVEAQTTNPVPSQVINAAHRDALHFSLNWDDYQKFLTEHFPPGSDYFKPSRHTSTAVLLKDSLYLQTFRTAAFYAVLDQRTPPPAHHSFFQSPFSKVEPAYTTVADLTAQKDAKNFTLTKDMKKKFEENPFPPTSDYFKPTPENASDPALVTDSAYVKTFRFEAFYKTWKQKSWLTLLHRP